MNRNLYFSRQLLLPHWGSRVQDHLKNAHVIVVGSGGLGSTLLMSLVGAGVGHVTIYDSDSVSYENLHRQIIFDISQVGWNKAQAAAWRLSKINPFCQIDARPFDFDHIEAMYLLEAQYPMGTKADLAIANLADTDFDVSDFGTTQSATTDSDHPSGSRLFERGSASRFAMRYFDPKLSDGSTLELKDSGRANFPDSGLADASRIPLLARLQLARARLMASRMREDGVSRTSESSSQGYGPLNDSKLMDTPSQGLSFADSTPLDPSLTSIPLSDELESTRRLINGTGCASDGGTTAGRSCVPTETVVSLESNAEPRTEDHPKPKPPPSLLIDCSDNLPTRLLMSDTAKNLGIPLVTASALRYSGHCVTLPNPRAPGCYRCIYREGKDPQGNKQSCNENGILGPVPALMGEIMAIEALKILVSKAPGEGGGAQEVSRLQGFPVLLFDFWAPGLFRRIVRVPQWRECKVCGRRDGNEETEWMVSDYQRVACRSMAAFDVEWSTFLGTYGKDASADNFVLIDVRPKESSDVYKLNGAIQLPADVVKSDLASLSVLMEKMHTEPFEKLREEAIKHQLVQVLSKCHGKPVYVYCRRGIGSTEVVQMLQAHQKKMAEMAASDTKENQPNQAMMEGAKRLASLQFYNLVGGLEKLKTSDPENYGQIIIV